jgi:plasmid stabilization system protein ParE
MPTESAKFHEEAIAEYDAAFDWYLNRSPDAARKFDNEVDRALAQMVHASRRWAVGLTSLAGSCFGSFLSHLFTVKLLQAFRS